MFDDFEYEGFWFLPEKPDVKLSGKLYYDADSEISLSLLGSFNFDRKDRDICILGISKEGIKLSLFGCDLVSFNYPSPGIPNTTYICERIFKNIHINSENEAFFERADIYVKGLDEWVGENGFHFSDIENNAFKLHYILPDEKHIYQSQDFGIFIDFTANSNSINTVYQQKVELQQFVNLRILFGKSIHISKIFQLIIFLGNLYSLIITKPSYVNKLVLYLDKKAQTEFNLMEPVEIFYVMHRSSNSMHDIKSKNMLFTYANTQNILQRIIDNWLSNCVTLKPVFDLFFGSLYNDFLYINNKFLSYVQALESYHRIKYQGTDLSEDEHSERLKSIIDSAPQNYQAWLQRKLLYSNEYTLRRRLKEILKHYSPIVNEYVTDIPNFVNKITLTRNYLTHFDYSLVDKIFTEEERINVSYFLKIILIICFLSEMGFTVEEIGQMIKANKQYSFEISKMENFSA